MDNKDFNNDTGVSAFNLLRSRLGISVSPSEQATVFVQLQDSRGFGEEGSTLADGSADNLDFHQAYFALPNLFGLPLDLKVGRMELAYGTERLIGAVGWHNIGRSFDGAVLRYANDKVWADFFSMKEKEGFAVENSGDRNLFGMYSNARISEKWNSDFFLIWQRSVPKEMLNRYTLGFCSNLTLGNFFNQSEFAYQGGKNMKLDVSALMLAINAGVKFPGAALRPVLSAGYEYLSGDNNPGDDQYKVFDTLYATNHKFYGFMDYFINIPAHTMGFGLVDLHVNVSITPVAKMTVSCVYHRFKTSESPDLQELNSNKIGDELDFTIKYSYDANVSLVGGFSLFTPDDFAKTSRGEDPSTWAYLMTVVNF